MSTYTVQVSDIAQATSEQHLHDFFSFCGKITSIDFNDKSEPKSATIHFEKPSAAKTALMLNGGTLDGAHLSVTSDQVHPNEPETHQDATKDGVDQAYKPRAGIAAEYIAKGYTLSDQILTCAIELDNQHGISKTFLTYFQSIDTTVGQRALGPDRTISGKVNEGVSAGLSRARTIDQQQGITKKAGDYYAQALATPFGQKVRAFYTTTSKQVVDIHEEARRIAQEQKNAHISGPAAGAPRSGPASAPTAQNSGAASAGQEAAKA